MRLLPQRLINTMRSFTNVSAEVFGMDCRLFVPNNMNSVETLDIYAKPTDYTFDEYKTKVWIEWSPNKHRLRKLGIFMEDEHPIIAWFGNVMIDSFGSVTDLDICVKSYFIITTQYIVNSGQNTSEETEEFEIVDVLIPSMADKVVRKAFRIAPRRIRTDA